LSFGQSSGEEASRLYVCKLPSQLGKVNFPYINCNIYCLIPAPQFCLCQKYVPLLITLNNTDRLMVQASCFSCIHVERLAGGGVSCLIHTRVQGMWSSPDGLL